MLHFQNLIADYKRKALLLRDPGFYNLFSKGAKIKNNVYTHTHTHVQRKIKQTGKMLTIDECR